MYGLRLWDSAGNLKLDIFDRLPKFVARYEVNRKADSASATDHMYGQTGIDLGRFNMTHTFNIPHPGVTDDGTWVAIITKMPSSEYSSAIGTNLDYITGYCVMSTDNIAVKILTGSTYYKDSLKQNTSEYASKAVFTIELYRQ
jgi:hypothetical protein